jgi:hypothetical protein
MDLQAVLPVSLISYLELVSTWGAGRPLLLCRWRLGACPLRQLQNSMGAWGCFRIYRTNNVRSPASEALTSVKDYASSSPLFFGRRVIYVQSPKHRPPTTALSKKLHSLPSSIRRIIQPRGWLVLARITLRQLVGGGADGSASYSFVVFCSSTQAARSREA